MAGLGTVDVLARLQLRARRAGLELRILRASADVVELIGLAGLTRALRVEPQRQAEAREERGGVEEERELGDPPVLP